MKIWNIPIESLEERYSVQWNRWFPHEFTRLGINYETIYPAPLTDHINKGVFLDICGTNYFKAMQLAELSKALHEGRVKEGDVLFFHDLWLPGLEMLQYIRQGLGIDFKIMGILHAGTYDKWDFLSQKGMGEWAWRLEDCWFSFVDKIFVATQFHKDLILLYRNVEERKIIVTGLPMCPSEFCFRDLNPFSSSKENIVVFPHRLDPEKCPEKFDLLKKKLKRQFPDWQFLRTKDHCGTKKEYYDLLQRSKIAVSFAEQETWGIAMLEAVFCGCLPVVPNRLSYPELYDYFFVCREENIGDTVENFMYHIEGRNGWFLRRWEENRQKLRGICHNAIEKMVNEMLIHVASQGTLGQKNLPFCVC